LNLLVNLSTNLNMSLLTAKPIIESIVPTISEGLNLAVVLVGDDMASQVYIEKKSQALKEVGGNLKLFQYPIDIEQEELIANIQKLNLDTGIDGIIVQLPLPPFIEEHKVLNVIHPFKDADGLTDYWLGKLFQSRISANLAPIIPATPKGILLLLDYYNINLVGKTVLIINDSVLVGKPLAAILPAYGATPILAHKNTKNLENLLELSDIIVSATGSATILEDVKFRAEQIIIDVGILRDEDNKIRGDIYHKDFNFDGEITPVPGGVGPLTVWALIQNLNNLKKLKSGELK